MRKILSVAIFYIVSEDVLGLESLTYQDFISKFYGQWWERFILHIKATWQVVSLLTLSVYLGISHMNYVTSEINVIQQVIGVDLLIT